MLLLAMACSGEPDNPGSTDQANNQGDSAAVEDSDFTWPEDTNGTRPDDPREVLADFSATNRDGSARGPADLQDGPTVIWFFPWADTPT
ncbi:MAG: hypothetical protein GY884_18960 [Proteobacteria bacterium]|nr:hypothetical protein [Pseudomonadota bacterium]